MIFWLDSWFFNAKKQKQMLCTTVKFCLLQRSDHTTDFTHTLHSLLYHSITTLADNEIEQQLRCPLWSSKFGACISVSCIKLSQISA